MSDSAMNVFSLMITQSIENDMHSLNGFVTPFSNSEQTTLAFCDRLQHLLWKHIS